MTAPGQILRSVGCGCAGLVAGALFSQETPRDGLPPYVPEQKVSGVVRNYGGAYAATFSGLFGKVAKAEKVSLVPFLLMDTALSPDLMQADGVHPNERGQPRLLATVWPSLIPLLSR